MIKYSLFDLDGTLFEHVFILQFGLHYKTDKKIYFKEEYETFSNHTRNLVVNYKIDHNYDKLAKDFIDLLALEYQNKSEDVLFSDLISFSKNNLKISQIASWVIPIFEKLNNLDIKIYIVTNSTGAFVRLFKYLLNKDAPHIEINGQLNSILKKDPHKKYNGEVLFYCNSLNKAEFMKKKFKEIDFNFTFSVGDSVGDIPLLLKTKKGFLITNNIDENTQIPDKIQKVKHNTIQNVLLNYLKIEL
ncbi:hypothetical protein GF362_02930 [Candidatus Dojkabacteria bacterium]|nr:hypothetical protein [Candidatus Dojkabacteria bacterium]